MAERLILILLGGWDLGFQVSGDKGQKKLNPDTHFLTSDTLKPSTRNLMPETWHLPSEARCRSYAHVAPLSGLARQSVSARWSGEDHLEYRTGAFFRLKLQLAA